MKECSYSGKRDRLTYLPVPIRSHIVSFLSLKEAARTSILSRRWEHICYSLSNLEFDQFDFGMKNSKGFRDFVDEVMSRHDGSDLRRLSLRVELDGLFMSSRHVNALISFAVLHNVKDFELSSYNDKALEPPSRFFKCSTLTKLTLVSVRMEWPGTVKFPVLKSFTLEDVNFYNENTINKLFSSCTCPGLENLEIGQCRLYIETLSISNPSLKYLRIYNDDDVVINISVPNLPKLNFMSYNPPEISFENLSSLLHVDLEFLGTICATDIVECCWPNSAKILMGLSNVVSLSLLIGVVEFLSRIPDLLACLPSSVWSLKYLEIEIFPTIIHIQVLKLLLRCYPNLETLHIDVYTMEGLADSVIINMIEKYQIEVLPRRDVLSNLRSVQIKEFDGSENEIDLVRFLLENAKFLEKMNISYSCEKKENAESQLWTSETLSTFDRVSSNVTISFF